nr:MAG TPA: protein of unknown function DUF285 [Siphoviridae sp. ctgbm9]
MKKIVKGNDFTLKIPVMKMVEGQPKAFPLPACTDVVVQVCNQFKRIPLAFEIDVKEDNVLLAKVEGDKMSLGTYAIEVKGKIFGNDWRSNEYPQFAIVANNADADTEFGETDEGDNSVEMDTAMVIIPPSVELSDLIDKANQSLKDSEATNTTLNENEEARKEAETLRDTAEQGRVSAEEARVSAEGDRTEAEEARISAEAERVKAEQARTKIEIERQANELTRKDNETKRIAAEQERAKAEEARVTAENSRVDAELQRVDAETQRASAESERMNAESSRVSAEKKRQSDTDAAIQNLNTHRTEFDDAEATRVNAEKSRAEAEATRKQAEADRAAAEGARVKAEENRADAEIKRKSDFGAAIKAAENATAGAEKVDATLTEGNVFEVTGRTGVKKTLDMSGLVSAQSDVERIQESMGAYSDRPDITLVAKETNKAISADGVKVTKAGWAIAEFTAELGNIYLFNPGETSSDVCVFAEYIDKVETRAIDYAYTYDESGRVITAKATYNGKTYTYTYDYSTDEAVITDQNNKKVSSLPSVYTTTIGAYNPMTILNTDAELPKDGYCRFVSNFTTASSIKIVVSYKIASANLTMKVVRDGSTANMCSQLAKINKKVDDIAERQTIKNKIFIHTCKEGAIVKLDDKEIQLEARRSYSFKDFLLFEIKGETKAINRIKVSGDTATSSTYAKGIFYQCSSLTSLDVSGWDTSKVTSLKTAFSNCSSLTSLDVSGWDTSKVTTMESTFGRMYNIKSLDVSGWDTSKVTNMNYMFARSSSLTFLDVSGWDTSKVTTMAGIFMDLVNITTLLFGEGFGKMDAKCGSLDLTQLSKLDNDSIKSLLTLYDRKANGMGVITLKLHAKTKKVLGEDGIAQLTAKGYIIE